MGLITYNGSVSKLLSLYFSQLKAIALHQFHKIWQLRNFNLALRNLQRGQVLFVHDFQMNLMLFTQDEPPGVHWDHPQLTIHPTAAFYRCTNKECNEIVREDIIHISDDRTHDKHAVNAFVAKSIAHLESKGVPVLEILEFTDQSSGQYKSKFTFNNITKFDIPYSRHFYGVKHGKGPSDRSGGRFKKSIRDAVKSKHILLSAADIEKYCRKEYYTQTTCNQSSNECHDENVDGKDPHVQRIVFDHPKPIPRPADENVKGIVGSRDWMHVVRNTGVQGVVQWRFFDCCCYACVTHSGNCSQQDYADPWTTDCIKGSADISQIKTDDWYRSMCDTHTQNDVGSLEIFDNSGEVERNENIDEVVDEHCNEIESYGLDGHEPLDPVFVVNADDDPVVECADSTDLRDENNHVSSENDVQSDEESDEESDEYCVIDGVEKYVSSEFSDEEIEKEDEGSTETLFDVIRSRDSSTDFNWEALVKDLESLPSYEALNKFILRTKLPPNETSFKIYFDEVDDAVDSVAQVFLPNDAPSGYVPVKTYGDGNCGPRAIAHVMLRDEKRYHEVRARITFEAVLKEEYFLRHDVLCRGIKSDTHNIAASYSHYSGQLTAEITFLSSRAIKTVYRRDVFANRLNGNYMGIWQFHHAAEAFKRPIGSVYPTKTNPVLRRDINRTVFPIESKNDMKTPVYVMWTPMRKNDNAWNVKHFVALLKKVIY